MFDMDIVGNKYLCSGLKNKQNIRYMKQYMGYFSQIVWGTMFLLWIVFTWVKDYESPITLSVLIAVMLCAVIRIIFRIRKNLPPEKPRIPLTDNNCAVIMFTLGLGNVMGYDNADYNYLAIVAVAAVIMDIFRRMAKDDII